MLEQIMYRPSLRQENQTESTRLYNTNDLEDLGAEALYSSGLIGGGSAPLGGGFGDFSFNFLEPANLSLGPSLLPKGNSEPLGSSYEVNFTQEQVKFEPSETLPIKFDSGPLLGGKSNSSPLLGSKSNETIYGMKYAKPAKDLGFGTIENIWIDKEKKERIKLYSDLLNNNLKIGYETFNTKHKDKKLFDLDNLY